MWLLTSRLSSSGNKISCYISDEIVLLLKTYLKQEVSETFLKKSNDFFRDMDFYLRNARQILTKHFASGDKDHLKKLDALIWSFVFFEKVPRYSDEVDF